MCRRGEAREREVPEGRSSNVRLQATTNGQHHSIVGHKAVCPLLRQELDKEIEQEAKMVASGGGGSRTADDYMKLGTKAGGRGQTDKAIAAFREGILSAPENAEAHYKPCTRRSGLSQSLPMHTVTSGVR